MRFLATFKPSLWFALVVVLGSPTGANCSGLIWRWSNPLPHGNSIVDMAWNGNLSVQVSELGQLYTGQTFFGWLPQVSGTTNDLQAVKFFGNRIVFAGANGTVGYSDDGVNFIANSLGTANWLVDMAVSSNLVVAVGDNAVIYTSADGASWTYRGLAPQAGQNWLLSAAWGAGTFVITGEGGYAATSSDGVHWTPHLVSTNLGVASDLTRVAWICTTNTATAFPYTGFWAVTSNGKAIYSTNNGVAWHLFSVGAGTNTFYAVAANDATGLITGDSDVRLGTGATNWSRQTSPLQTPSPAPVWVYYTALWDDTNSAYRLVGDNGMMVESTVSTNGNYLWQEQYGLVPRDWLWQVTLVGDLYVAVGDNTRIMTSQNGIDWSIESVPLTNSVTSPATNNVFFAVGGDTNLLVAAGNHGCLAISPNTGVPVVVTNLDGTTFTNIVGSLGVVWVALPAPTTNDLAGACVYRNNYFLAGGNATLLSSGDGTNWSRLSVPTTNYLSGLAPGTNLVVATGDQGVILTSPDGVSWTKRSSGTTNWLWRARWLNGWFLAFGENGVLLKSSDGLSWSSVASGTTNWLNDAIMVSNMCYLVGNNGTVLSSGNLVNWTNVGTITSLSLYGAATQNGQLLTVGLEGTILRAQVIPNLTPPDIVSYTQSSGENIFLVGGVPDQRFTLDSSTNLVNWTTGPLLDLIYGSGTLVFITQLGTNPPPTQYYRATLVP